MDIFDLSVEQAVKEMKKLLAKTIPEELLEDLIKCGYEHIDMEGINNE